MTSFPGQAGIVIVGGGAIGCAIAYHLARRGARDVLLLERRQLTHGSTWHAAGLVGQLRSSKNLTRLMQRSAALYRTLEAETGQATGWHGVGSLRLAASAERWDELRRAATTGKGFGFELHLASPEEARRLYPLLDAKGRLSNRFLLVSNIRPADVSAVVGGNERVVRPRLADARFFFEQDRKKSLESRVPGLAKVVYHNKLGTQGERVERVRTIARAIGKALGGDALAASADRAALLAKADLLTDMVGEFPELQGVMGGYYARNDREAEEVAQAVEDHYRPRFSGDALPRNQAGIAVALADKVETLVGLFGIGQVPTGDKDPFALRRHALGVIRMVTERELPLALDALVGTAVPAFGDRITDPRAALTDFVFDRLAFLAREQGFSAKEVDSVVSLRPQRLAEVPRRLAAVRAFAGLAEAVPLAEANKRIGNILRKSELPAGARTDTALLREPAEQALHKALEGAVARAMPLFAKGDFQAGLVALAALKAPVDAFFDAVMVNVDDAALRTNRLALLQQLHALMNQVADLSRLAQ